MNASDPPEPVRAHLEGNAGDLKTLSADFPDRVRQEPDDRWALLGSELDAAWGDPGRLHEVAVAAARQLNGAARMVHPRFCPVRVVGRYDGPGNGVTVVSGEPAHVQVTVMAGVLVIGSDGTPVPPPPPPGPGLLAAAGRSGDLAEVLCLLGAPELMTTWDMWKVVEVIRQNVGGPNPKTATPALINTGWISPDEWRSLKDALNNPHVTGADARHARHGQPAPTTTPIGLDQARELVSRLSWSWAQTL